MKGDTDGCPLLAESQRSRSRWRSLAVARPLSAKSGLAAWMDPVYGNLGDSITKI